MIRLRAVMPAHAGIHVFLACSEGVDGRDKPGHDERDGSATT